MAYYAVHTADGAILKTIECPPFIVARMTFDHGLLVTEIKRVADDKNEIVNDGKLAPKPQAAE